MSTSDISKARDPDLAASLAAMRRAARSARETAIRTNTAIVIVQDGRLVHVSAEDLRQGMDGRTSRRGALRQYGEPDRIGDEQGAWQAAASETHGLDV